MKRRNAESGKMRRPIKRNKITEGIYGSTLLYLKFVLLWAMVIFADYILEFRFEFLWPFWMMLRSVYDSFKYQGLAFSVFFICIALTSDMICFFFIPVQWVFFAASTYVWVQYVWYTDKGICLPTVVLCAVLVYIEAAVRGVRDTARSSAAGQLDLCRPFAAHCVGYPVVTLGFGVKSYVGHRMRLRRQRDVQAENRFYYQLLRQALPESANEAPAIKDADNKSIAIANGTADKPESDQKHMNGNAVHANSSSRSKRSEAKCSQQNSTNQEETKSDKHLSNHNHSTSYSSNVKTNHHNSSSSNHTLSNGVLNNHVASTTDSKHNSSEDKHSSGVTEKETEVEEKRHKNDVRCQNDTHLLENNANVEKSRGHGKTNTKWEKKENTSSVQREERRKNKNRDKEKDNDCHKEQNKENNHHIKDNATTTTTTATATAAATKEAQACKEREREMGEELRRARAELAGVRSAEAELRKALAAAAAGDRQRRHEHQQLKHANEELHSKVATLTSSRASERSALERKLVEERRARTTAESQLAAARQQHQQRLQQNKTSECGGEWCRARRAAADSELCSARRELQRVRDRSTQLARDLHSAGQQVSSLETRCRETAAAGSTSNGDTAAALAALRERAQHLERSLSAETRIKLDLFSALGEAKRQLEIREGLIRTQEKEIEELKAKIAQMLAVMPTDSFVGPSSAGPGMSKLRLSARHSPEGPSVSPLGQSPFSNLHQQANSNLDPNATAYTPKGAMVSCGNSADV